MCVTNEKMIQEDLASKALSPPILVPTHLAEFDYFSGVVLSNGTCRLFICIHGEGGGRHIECQSR